MGNACTQDCDAAEIGATCEAAFNSNAEHAPSQSYAYVDHVNGFSKTSPRELPRLGLHPSTPDPFLGKGFSGLKEKQLAVVGHVLPSEERWSRHNTWFRADIALPLEPPDESPSRNGSVRAISAHDLGEDDFLVPPDPGSFEREDDKVLVDELVADAEAGRQSVLQQILLPVMSPRKTPNVTMSPYVGLVFNAEGKETYIQLHRRPLGAEFNATSLGSAGISRVKPQSYAEELGLQEGWIMSCIDGEDVSMKTLKETQNILNHALMKLPTQKRA